MKYAFAILFLLVLATPIVLNRVMGRGSESVSQDAGADQLVIITPHNESIRREFEEAFIGWYQQKYQKSVNIDYLSFGAAEIRRVLQSGTYTPDIAWGGGDSTFNRDLKEFLAPVPPDPEFDQLIKDAFPQPTLAGLRLYEGSTPPLWYGTVLSSFGIGYNKDVVRYLGVGEPRTWADLKDPRYRGWVLLADPTRSSSARTAFMVIVERAMADAVAQGRTEDEGWSDGMGLIRLIASNARSFNDAAGTLPSMVADGEAAAAMMIDFYARSQIQHVGDDRMGYVEPANATIINPDPIAMLKTAQHPQVAMRFIEFVLSEQGQRLFNLKPAAPGGPKATALRRLPVRKSVYSDTTNFTDPIDPFTTTTSFNTSPARTKTMTIIGVLIQASCMDCLDDLRKTRKLILASPEAQRLDRRLGTFEYDQQHALKLADQYKKASPIEQLKLMREWSDYFRECYAALRQEATK